MVLDIVNELAEVQSRPNGLLAMGDKINSMKEEYGNYWPQVIRQLKEEDPSLGMFQVVASVNKNINDPSKTQRLQNDLIKAMSNKKNDKLLYADSDPAFKGLRDAMVNVKSDVRSALISSPEYRDREEAFELLTKDNIKTKGMNVTQAAKAAAEYIYSDVDVVGGIVYPPSRIQNPNEFLAYANSNLKNIAMLPNVGDELKQQIYKNPQFYIEWRNNETGNGVRAVWKDNSTFAGEPVTTNDMKYLEYKFDDYEIEKSKKTLDVPVKFQRGRGGN
jgi:hypothetical protein